MLNGYVINDTFNNFKLHRGHVTVECTAYKGGVIVRAWQLNNHEIDVDNRGMFIFPLAD